MLPLSIVVLFCFGMAAYALITGTLIMRGRYERESRPFWYWFGVVSYLGLGIYALVVLIKVVVRS